VPESTWKRLYSHDGCWPAGWQDLSDPPNAALVTGMEQTLAQPMLAIVGTRSASARGLAFARHLAREAAERGWTVTSGLALGIDGEAHKGALDAGARTAAVMATGPERTYPAQHRSLRARIEESGCCVTETEPGEGAGGRWLFPRRNRLIAAMSAGIIVVEAPRRSGALLTAAVAVDLGRPVWAVPGPVDSPLYEGCHDLLRDGAMLCTGAADIDSVLPPPKGPASAVAGPPIPLPGSAARWVLDRLDLDGVALEDLRMRWPGTDAMWSEGLLALELAGLIRRLPGGRLAPRIWRA
jgi:DNA processing protein